MLIIMNVLYRGCLAQGLEWRDRKVRDVSWKRGWREARVGRRLWSRMRVWRLGTSRGSLGEMVTISFLESKSSCRRVVEPRFDSVVIELSVRS